MPPAYKILIWALLLLLRVSPSRGDEGHNFLSRSRGGSINHSLPRGGGQRSFESEGGLRAGGAARIASAFAEMVVALEKDKEEGKGETLSLSLGSKDKERAKTEVKEVKAEVEKLEEVNGVFDRLARTSGIDGDAVSHGISGLKSSQVIQLQSTSTSITTKMSNLEGAEPVGTVAFVEGIPSVVGFIKDPSLASLADAVQGMSVFASVMLPFPFGLVAGGAMAVLGGWVGSENNDPSNKDLADQIQKNFERIDSKLDTVTKALDALDDQIDVLTTLSTWTAMTVATHFLEFSLGPYDDIHSRYTALQKTYLHMAKEEGEWKEFFDMAKYYRKELEHEVYDAFLPDKIKAFLVWFGGATDVNDAGRCGQAMMFKYIMAVRAELFYIMSMGAMESISCAESCPGSNEKVFPLSSGVAAEESNQATSAEHTCWCADPIVKIYAKQYNEQTRAYDDEILQATALGGLGLADVTRKSEADYVHSGLADAQGYCFTCIDASMIRRDNYETCADNGWKDQFSEYDSQNVKYRTGCESVTKEVIRTDEGSSGTECIQQGPQGHYNCFYQDEGCVEVDGVKYKKYCENHVPRDPVDKDKWSVVDNKSTCCECLCNKRIGDDFSETTRLSSIQERTSNYHCPHDEIDITKYYKRVDDCSVPAYRVRCWEESATYNVRCCNMNADVCEPHTCSDLKTHREAEAYCSKLGMRLCLEGGGGECTCTQDDCDASWDYGTRTGQWTRTACQPYRQVQPPATACPYNKAIESYAECEVAGLHFGGALRSYEDSDVWYGNVKIGSWDHVPTGCSAQGDGTGVVHFNTKPNGGNDGGYTLLCKIFY